MNFSLRITGVFSEKQADVSVSDPEPLLEKPKRARNELNLLGRVMWGSGIAAGSCSRGRFVFTAPQ